MKVLLSIKPKYIEKATTGEKQYDFEKTILRNKNVRKAYIYSISPTKKIVSKFVYCSNTYTLYNIHNIIRRKKTKMQIGPQPFFTGNLMFKSPIL